MNCATALETMLDAELPDLAGQGMMPLAAHVATCTRCRTVAQRLHADTRLLAISIAPSEAWVRRQPPVWIRWTPVPVGLVAALLLMLAPRSPDVPPNVTVGASSKPAVIVPDVVVPPRAATKAASLLVQHPKPTRLRAYPAPIPVAAVRINPPPRAIALPGPDIGPAVIVDPPAGQRVAVMRTSNPKITVVWLY